MHENDSIIIQIKKSWSLIGNKLRIVYFWIAIGFFICLGLGLILMSTGYFFPDAVELTFQRTCRKPTKDIRDVIWNVESYRDWRSDINELRILHSNRDMVEWTEAYGNTQMFFRMKNHKDNLTVWVSSDPSEHVGNSASEQTQNRGIDSKIEYTFEIIHDSSIITVKESTTYRNVLMRGLAYFIRGRRLKNQISDLTNKYCQ